MAWWKRAILWEAPLLAALGAFMFWVRMLPYKPLVGSGRAYYIGTDPFFHFRETLGIVRSFPRVPRWDPWTFYPNGTATNQFGTLFDWFAALYVVLTEGRGASEQYVGQVLGVYPAVIGALLVVPFYYCAKRLLGVVGAVMATVTIALLPGEFLIRSIAGYSDHHVFEAFMALISILGVYVAATKGQAARDSLASLKDVRAYRTPLLFALLGGLALGLNFYAWPPALLFLAILTLWLTVVILLEDSHRDGDARGYVFGGVVAFALAGLMMVPVMETTDLSDFNAYGLLQIVAPLLAAAWLVVIHVSARMMRARGAALWILPAVVTVLVLSSVLVVYNASGAFFESIRWGLSWVTGLGTPRTTLTIAEARQAAFFCSRDTAELSCLASDFGAAAPISFLILLVLVVWVVIKRRPSDVLLLIWSLVAFRATTTQIRFSYYLALNIALLIGWLAARVSEWTGLEAALAGQPVATGKARATKGRKTKAAQASAAKPRVWQVAAVAAVFLIVVPGNVLANNTRARSEGESYLDYMCSTAITRPGWVAAGCIRGADGDLILWMEGLDWMRTRTPDAGVDLAAIVPRPAPGDHYDYPPQTYGVLTWWDYGHWIETVALRPPVANPFQQAAPFAATWFTERDPRIAEQQLDDWVRGEGPVRYVFIDDAIATGKWGAITVWANSQNASRARWAGGAYLEDRVFTTSEGPRTLRTFGPEYRESMMGRLYDRDGAGLGRYRLVWEHGDYQGIGNVATADGNIPCLHDVVPSGGCPVSIDLNQVQPGTQDRAFTTGDGSLAYDLIIASRLKLFERVEGARLVGTTTPGARVTAGLPLWVDNGVNRGYPQGIPSFTHTEEAVAGPDGRFELVWPYPTVGFLAPADGGTDAAVKPSRAAVVVTTPTGSADVEVLERAVLDGSTVQVTLG